MLKYLNAESLHIGIGFEEQSKSIPVTKEIFEQIEQFTEINYISTTRLLEYEWLGYVNEKYTISYLFIIDGTLYRCSYFPKDSSNLNSDYLTFHAMLKALPQIFIL